MVLVYQIKDFLSFELCLVYHFLPHHTYFTRKSYPKKWKIEKNIEPYFSSLFKVFIRLYKPCFSFFARGLCIRLALFILLIHVARNAFEEAEDSRHGWCAVLKWCWIDVASGGQWWIMVNPNTPYETPPKRNHGLGKGISTQKRNHFDGVFNIRVMGFS